MACAEKSSSRAAEEKFFYRNLLSSNHKKHDCWLDWGQLVFVGVCIFTPRVYIYICVCVCMIAVQSPLVRCKCDIEEGITFIFLGYSPVKHALKMCPFSFFHFHYLSLSLSFSPSFFLFVSDASIWNDDWERNHVECILGIEQMYLTVE